MDSGYMMRPAFHDKTLISECWICVGTPDTLGRPSEEDSNKPDIEGSTMAFRSDQSESCEELWLRGMLESAANDAAGNELEVVKNTV